MLKIPTMLQKKTMSVARRSSKKNNVSGATRTGQHIYLVLMLKIPTMLEHARPGVKTNKNKVLPGFEPGLQESGSWVLTTTL